MKRLNQKEKEIAKVASDLFLKGSPEWRIAEYAYYKGLTVQQLSNFLEKLTVLPENVKFTIYTHYKDISRGDDWFDKSRQFGETLSRWLKQHVA